MSSKLLSQLIILHLNAISNSILFQSNFQKGTILKRLYTIVLLGYKSLFIKPNKIKSIIKISRIKFIIKTTIPTTVNEKIIRAAAF